MKRSTHTLPWISLRFWVCPLVTAGVLAAIPVGLGLAAENPSKTAGQSTTPPRTVPAVAAKPSEQAPETKVAARNVAKPESKPEVKVKTPETPPEPASLEPASPEPASPEPAPQEPAPPAPTRKSGGWVGVSLQGGEVVPIGERPATPPATASKTPQWGKKGADPTTPTPSTDASERSATSAKPVTPPAHNSDDAVSGNAENAVSDDMSLAPSPLPLPTEDEPTKDATASDETDNTDEAGVASSSTEKPRTSATTTPTQETTNEDAMAEAADETDSAIEDSGLLVDGNRVGDLYSATKVRMLFDEVMAGIQSRGITGRYGQWVNYARNTLRNTAGTNTGSELDGRFRLNWYRDLYGEPIKSVIEVDQFSRDLHDAMSGTHLQIAAGMEMIRKKLDSRARGDSDGTLPEVATPHDAVQAVVRAMTEARAGHAQSLAHLNRDELQTLSTSLYDVFTKSATSGHTIPNRTQGRQLVDLMRKVDYAGFCRAAEAIALLTNPAILEQLALLPDDAFPRASYGGQSYQRLTTTVGDILISNRENKIIDLDAHDLRDVVCIISRGGNDVYREGVVSLERPLLVIIDLDGDDVYTGSRPGIQGGAILGISAIIDAAGNNSYTASDVAQGSALCGVGLLFDLNTDGKTTYKAFRRAQGHALAGIGVAIDRGGDDTYRAALWAQGFGAPGGFGLLENVRGNDLYYCGGQFYDSYPEHPGYDGWGQGIGAGIRQVANGGLGVILDGAGDDTYEVDYFGHGGGYWMGLGFARDFGGNDKRMGSTILAYNGTPRTQERWTRFSNGWGCHYSLGYVFDDGGDDLYGGKIMGGGMAWDLSIGYLLSLGGNDTYSATGGMTQGVGAEGSIGILFSYGGNDTFMGRNQGNAGGGITYHSPSNCGGNFSFVVNYGGEDNYGSKVPNNAYTQRGSTGGFVIDRPFHDEYEQLLVANKRMAEQAKIKLDADVLGLEAAKEGKSPQMQRSIQMQITRLQQQYQKTSATPQRPTIGAVTRLGAPAPQAAQAATPAATPAPEKTATSPAERPVTK